MIFFDQSKYWLYKTSLMHMLIYNVKFFLKARTVEPEKQPFLGNGFVTRNNGVAVRSGVFCAVRAGAI
jgi:hypothetical protein